MEAFLSNINLSVYRKKNVTSCKINTFISKLSRYQKKFKSKTVIPFFIIIYSTDK